MPVKTVHSSGAAAVQQCYQPLRVPLPYKMMTLLDDTMLQITGILAK